MEESKSIVITGASSGIGAALTKTLAADGHRLFICARRPDPLAEVTAATCCAFHATCDVTAEDEVQRFFAAVGERTPSIDVLIHCAAVIGPIGPTTDIDSNEWWDALRTDLFGAFLTTKYVVPLMRPERRPRILLLSGGGAFDPMPNLSAYGVSKAAVVRLAETLAIELAPRNIAVNIFAPGFVATDIFKSVIEAGPARGGTLYDTIVKLLDSWKETDIDLPIACARFLISNVAAPLTGKTVSARHDPWDVPEYRARLPEIVKSRLYATQRTNLEHLRGKPFVERIIQALERRKLERGAPGASGEHDDR